MRIGVLGPVRLWRDDGEPVSPGPAGQRAVLALLALAGGHPLSRGELVDGLWQQSPPASVANVLQTYIKRLRRILEPDRRPRSRSRVLPGVGDGYALRIDPDDVDVFRFRRLVAAAAATRRDADPYRAVTLLTEALALWDGPPLVDVPALADHPKAVALVEERYAALGAYGDAMVAAGTAVDALPTLEEAAAARPFDEAGQARLIRAYQVAGRRARAFERYHEVRHLLDEELGVEPGPELAAAHTALLHGPDDLGGRPVGAPDRVAPVPAQLPADVAGFTGRAAELAALDAVLDALDRSAAAPGGPPPATAVVLSGTAGVGKTALAVRWAHRVRHRFPDGQLYVDLRGYDPDRPVPPGDALARFLRSLGVAGADVPAGIDEQAARFRSLLDGRRMLLVLDNAASVEAVEPLLPGTPSCVAVVTSRDLLPALVARHGAHRIELDLLPPGDAADLVRVLVGERVEAEPDAVSALLRQCARLPLALRVAAELILARPAAPLADLVGELADQQRRLEVLDAGGNQRTGVQAVFS
ncbi:MAG TPA: BTAD domain-containing putative transcriptional regulator, partial [Mycobacteriales bacterium]|nr:BTAD domain-containing putative transcriptional regulator [Mycobacteriales bacterium]